MSKICGQGQKNEAKKNGINNNPLQHLSININDNQENSNTNSNQISTTSATPAYANETSSAPINNKKTNNKIKNRKKKHNQKVSFNTITSETGHHKIHVLDNLSNLRPLESVPVAKR